MKKLKKYESFFGGTKLGNQGANSNTADVKNVTGEPDHYNNDTPEVKKNTIWTDRVINWCKNQKWEDSEINNISRTSVRFILKKTGCPEDETVVEKTFREMNQLDNETPKNI
jgi:hypothetical protein